MTEMEQTENTNLTPKEELKQKLIRYNQNIKQKREHPTPEDLYNLTLKQYQKDVKRKSRDKKVTHNEVAKKLLKLDHYKTMEDTKELYIYRNGIYVNEGEIQVEKNVEKVCYETASKHFTSEVIGVIKRQTYTKRKFFDTDPNLLTVKNGILNLETNTLTEHTPDHLSVIKYNIMHNPNAKAKKILKFLEQVCPKPEFRQTLIDMIAYCFLPHHKYHVWLILVGSGDNGKTTFINLVNKFLGEENTISISLQDLLTKRFLIVNLFGKSANICDDLPSSPLKYTGIIKTLTGEGSLTVDVKHKDPITFTSKAKQIFTCNTLAKTEDTTHAFFSRVLIVEFVEKFLKGDPNTDPDLLEKLTTEEEFSGLLNICIKTIKEIKDNGRIRYPFTTEEMRDQYNRFSSALSTYVFSSVEKDIESSITKGDLFTDYVKYANEHKLNIMESNVFSRKIKPLILGLGGTDGFIGKNRAWNGIRLKTEEEKVYTDLEDFL